jgi:hypothetical protein
MHELPKMEGGPYSEPISLIGVVAKHRAIVLGNFDAWPYRLDSHVILRNSVAFACREEGS